VRPVLIGGSPRSGTTLLGALLGAAPEAITTPESGFKIDLLRDVGPRSAWDVAAAQIGADPRFEQWGVDVPDAPVQPTDDDATTMSVVLAAVRAYALAHGRPDATVWVDHTPSNIRFAARLHRVFPDARFVHVLRDGRGVASSLLPLDWGQSTPLRAAEGWAADVACGLAAEEALGADRVRRVRFEDLVATPGEVLGEVLEFVGLERGSVTADERGYTPRSAYGQRRSHTRVAGPIDPSRATAWRHELAPRDIEIIEGATGDLLELLGYPLVTGDATTHVELTTQLHAMVSEAWQTLVVARLVRDRPPGPPSRKLRRLRSLIRAPLGRRSSPER